MHPVDYINKKFCTETFRYNEMCLILESFKEVQVTSLELCQAWPLTAITNQVFQAITCKNLDTKWQAKCQELMSKLYQLTENELKSLQQFIFDWKQSNDIQKRHTLQKFPKPAPATVSAA